MSQARTEHNAAGVELLHVDSQLGSQKEGALLFFSISIKGRLMYLPSKAKEYVNRTGLKRELAFLALPYFRHFLFFHSIGSKRVFYSGFFLFFQKEVFCMKGEASHSYFFF